jgi:hypothetical protein
MPAGRASSGPVLQKTELVGLGETVQKPVITGEDNRSFTLKEARLVLDIFCAFGL